MPRVVGIPKKRKPMSKFVAFEMVFNNQVRFMGNMVIPHNDIECDNDIQEVELYIKQKLNDSVLDNDDIIDVITITNWKPL